MVDISEKQPTRRIATAQGKIQVNQAVMDAILNHTAKKGDVLGVARVAGIMGVKQTASLIPMCHTLLITKCTVDFEIDETNLTITAFCTVKTEGKTGVEMEALTGVQVALLTARINDLQIHFKANPKDYASKRGLLMLVGQRRRLLAYVKNRNIDEYRALIAELGLRK